MRKSEQRQRKREGGREGRREGGWERKIEVKVETGWGEENTLRERLLVHFNNLFDINIF